MKLSNIISNNLFIGAFVLLTGCNSNQEPDSKTITLTNPSDFQRTEVVHIDLIDELEPGSIEPTIGKIGSTVTEAIDIDDDGKPDYLLAEASLEAESSLKLNLTDWTKDTSILPKTQAELSHAIGGTWEGNEYLGGTGFEHVDFLSVPPSHTDHSWFIRYEGPGWENELIGYRFYLDWRNATDIFGKKVDTLVLQTVGQDGFDSYHEESDWGMDILKAGKSLGIGSIGRLNSEGTVEHFEQTDSVTCEIERSGYLSSSIETKYYGWQTSEGTCTLSSLLTIYSGDRATTHTITFDQEVDNFCTGIVKHPEGVFFQESEGEWGYIATWGKQTLFDDQLGMAIFYQLDQFQKVDTTDAHNHLVVFKPTEKLSYQFLGAWEKEPKGIKSIDDFKVYLRSKLEALNRPIEIKR